MARTGKIARLPRALREELNRHLDEGEAGVDLVAWLNGRRGGPGGPRGLLWRPRDQ